MRVVALVPAFNNEEAVGETVKALLSDPRIQEVVVVDDGSNDETAEVAADAGARVIRMDSNRGKGSALSGGLSDLAADIVLMVDGDTGSSAAEALSLVDPVERGDAAMAIGVLPPAGKSGGFGLVKRIAARLILLTSGFQAIAPLSGQRAASMDLLKACSPLARGFGVDAALTSDAVRAGFRVIEIPVAMSHDHRGRSARGFAHRALQGFHLVRALVPRMLRR